ncbi:MAG: NAD(P)H-hydrate epimerase, partial [Gemmatimonadota bacterium]
MTADQAAARDAAAIAAGVPSMQLMRRAGLGAARALLHHLAPFHARRAVVCCGPGNNGGDGWIVAAALAEAGLSVHVREVGEARTADAAVARAEAVRHLALGRPDEPPDVVVDALLGTGARGPLRGGVAELAGYVDDARRGGAR